MNSPFKPQTLATSTNRIPVRAGGIFLSIVIAFFAATALARAEIVPLDQRVAGKTYGEWIAYFWTVDLQRASEPSFASHLSHQSGPVLWLWGSSRPTVRAITIPDDRHLYIGILDLACTTLDEPPLRPASTNEADIRACAESFHATGLFLEIDGVTVPNIDQYRLLSTLFYFNVPAVTNVFALPYATNGLGVANGAGVILEPLSPGSHQIRFRGTYPGLFTADVTYNITVYPRPVISAQRLSNTGTIELSWRTSTGIPFTLQQSESADANGNWSNATISSLNNIGDTAFATVTNVPTKNLYFRLIRSL